MKKLLRSGVRRKNELSLCLWRCFLYRQFYLSVPSNGFFFFVNLVDAIMSRKGYCSPASAYTAHGPVIRRYKGSLLLPVVLFINMCYKSRQNPLHVRVVHIRAGTLTDLVAEAGQKADQTSNRRTLVQN